MELVTVSSPYRRDACSVLTIDYAVLTQGTVLPVPASLCAWPNDGRYRDLGSGTYVV
jgi:hypothetical protein